MKQNWEYKKLGDVCTIERGGSPRPIEKFITDDPNGLNWIKIGDAVEGSKYIISTKEKIKPEGLKKTRLVHKGDFILSNSMSFGRPYILDIDGCIHDGWLVIHDEHKVFDKIYLYYLLSSPNMYSEFKRLAVGGVVNNLNSQLVRNVFVAIPPLEEQSRIVAELDLLTGIIDKQNAQLKELDNLAQAIFYDMFGDPIENPKGWNVKNLGSVCDFKNGLNFAPDETGEKYYLIGVSDFQTKSRLECNQSLKTIELNKPLSEEYLLVDDDILFVRSNGNKDLIARNVLVAIKGLKVTYSGFCIRARVKNNDVLPFFLNSLLKLPSAHNALTASGHGCNIANLNQKTLDGFQLILPPLALQQSFAEKIQSIEKQKETIRASIVDTQKLLDYTMDKYFG